MFYAGCQPEYPSGYCLPPELYVPGADAPYLPGAGWTSFRTSEVLGTYPPQLEYSFNVPPHGTFMVQLYYMRSASGCQQENRRAACFLCALSNSVKKLPVHLLEDLPQLGDLGAGVIPEGQ